jgi:hypothetical protein
LSYLCNICLQYTFIRLIPSIFLLLPYPLLNFNRFNCSVFIQVYKVYQPHFFLHPLHLPFPLPLIVHPLRGPILLSSLSFFKYIYSFFKRFYCLAGGQPPHGDQGLSARLSTPSSPSFHGYHGNSRAQLLWCTAIRGFMVTMATPPMVIRDFPFTLLLPLPL